MLATIFERIKQWVFDDGAWWLSSVLFHAIVMCILMLAGSTVVPEMIGNAPEFESPKESPSAPDAEKPLDRFEVAETPEEPTGSNAETPTLELPGQIAQTEQYNNDSPVFSERGGGVEMNSDQPLLGGLGGFDVMVYGPGPAVRGPGGVGAGVGTGTNPGSGGNDIGFGGRGTGWRKAMLGRQGGTKQSERAVAGALNWLARHQMPTGNWSLEGYLTRCKDPSCSGPGSAAADMGATALALLPFLGAGHTHKSKGPYKTNILNGLNWMIKNQQRDGDLRASSTMYSHGLAAIALCEAYGMTKDPQIRDAAQRAVNFIEAAQSRSTGGWRYHPGVEDGDTSVVGWQLMALKSAYMAGLAVNTGSMENVKQWLNSVASGYQHEQYAYQPNIPPSQAMTSVGLLCQQYLGLKRNDPMMISGAAYLMANLPDINFRDTYYWYYAAQVMHNYSGPDWDAWNRKMRRTLIDTQDKEKCAAGSWDPVKPVIDKWGIQGGRILATSLSALTLEVYYRYLPLYKLDKEEELANPPAADKAEAKQAEKIEKIEAVDP